MHKKGALKRSDNPLNRMLAKLSESGLMAQHAKTLQLKPLTEKLSKELHLSRAGAGIKIPYFDLSGKPLATMFRFRYFDAVEQSGFLKGLKLRKYDQPQNSPVEVYLPPLTDWRVVVKDPTQAVLFTEGELKSACATKHGWPTIGLGGVDCWGGRKQGQRLHPTLMGFEWRGRAVAICFDSDAARKPEVMGAENRLAAALLDAGAVVCVVRIPEDGEEKVGLDNYIVKHGVEKFDELLAGTPEWARSRHLHELNAQYVVCLQSQSVFDAAKGRMYSRESFENLIEAHRSMEQTDGKKTRTVRAAKEWVQWPARSLVDSLTYEPGQQRITAHNKLNLWNDSGIEPREGDTAPFDELIAHLMPNDTERRWFVQWAAYPLQHPGARNNTAVLLWSYTQGTGKSLLGETIGLLHGRENYIEIGQPQLESEFNDWQARRTFIMGSELCGTSLRDVRAFADKLKSLVTANDTNVNKKYEPEYSVPNKANYFLTSNRPTALHLDEHARRFFVVHATEHKLPQEFYTPRFLRWRDNGGLGALLHKMLHVDLSGFQPGADAPKTQHMHEMVADGRSELQEWCVDLRQDAEATLLSSTAPPILATARFATAQQLLNAFQVRVPESRVNQKQMALELASAGLVRANRGVQVRIPKTRTRERLWILRDDARAAKMSPDEIGQEWGKLFGNLRSRMGGGR